MIVKHFAYTIKMFNNIKQGALTNSHLGKGFSINISRGDINMRKKTKTATRGRPAAKRGRPAAKKTTTAKKKAAPKRTAAKRKTTAKRKAK